MSWTAVNKYILAKEVKEEKEERVTDSGIVIPATSEEAAEDGVIYEVVYYDESIEFLQEGQRFIVSPSVATNAPDIIFGGEELKHFNEKNLLLVERD